MKTLASLLIAATLIAPSGAVYAQRTGTPPDGGGIEDCSYSVVQPGKRATLKQIAKARDASVHRVPTCEDIYVEKEFEVAGQAAAIANNDKLRVQLRANGLFPHQVIGVQIHKGRLTIYAHAI